MANEELSVLLDESVFQRRRPAPNNNNGLGRRKHYRHPLRWRVAVVNKSGGQHDIYHGRTHDLSLSGASILVERNLFFTSDIVVLLAVPPAHHGQRETILEIQCKIMHTVLDSDHGLFRMGMKFVQFKGEGKRILHDILSKRHIPKQEAHPYYLQKHL